MAGSLIHETLGAELGFLDKTDKWRLESRYFPSKVGGKPAWLDLRNLPPTENMLCSSCQKPFTFLAQVYAPDDDDEGGTRVIKETGYHRTIYIFFCTDIGCNMKNSNKNFKVLRSQLAKHNEFYPPIDPPDDPDWKKDITVANFTKVCKVCGCLGTKICGSCKKVNYCTRDHQVLHWKNGHKQLCQQETTGKDEDYSKFTLPEYEIIIDDEKLEVNRLSKTDKEQLEEFEKILKSKNPTFQNDESIDDSLEQSVSDVSEDKMFSKFKEKVSDYPDQILRYGRGETPLWVSDLNMPLSIPNCEFCNSERKFEFQIMPQMLNYLKLDNLSDDHGVDWGTLLIYTCENSCDEGPAYKEEYLWKQDFSGKNSV